MKLFLPMISHRVIALPKMDESSHRQTDVTRSQQLAEVPALDACERFSFTRKMNKWEKPRVAVFINLLRSSQRQPNNFLAIVQNYPRCQLIIWRRGASHGIVRAADYASRIPVYFRCSSQVDDLLRWCPNAFAHYAPVVPYASTWSAHLSIPVRCNV